MDRVKSLLWIVVALVSTLNFVLSESEPNRYAPELDMKDTDGNTVDAYRGFILTNEKTVSLVPALAAHDNDSIGGARFICGYKIYDDTVPFEAVVSNHDGGVATLQVKANVDLSKLLRKKYKFEIAAYDCGAPTLHGPRANVVVQVIRSPSHGTPPLPTAAVTPPLPKDVRALVDKQIQLSQNSQTLKKLVKQTPPVPESSTTLYPKLPLPDVGGEQFFERLSYIVMMKEGTLYDSVLKLKPAVGKSTKNICAYEIVTPGVPFSVNDLGTLRNTKALSVSVQKSYILSIVAKHCDGLVSKPVMVNVQVNAMCANGWKELPTDQEYTPGNKPIFPFADTWFDTCSASCEKEETMAVTVSVESDGAMNTCDHDASSIQNQRDMCGASPSTVDLLPMGKSWTKDLKPVKGHEAAYNFDGKTAVKVPSENSNHTLGKFFTIATWMQHGLEKKDGHKEHILCNSDGNGMNRHHYALFVHNCRLVFLLRKEANQVKSLESFQPAEWRWSIPHVCDAKWHHYAISVSYPQVTLYVDGQAIQTDKEVVSVVDDWAMHSSSKVTFEQLTVGGCWKGESKSFGYFFDGQLAGLTLLTGTTETERTIKCMNSCGEKLQFNAMHKLTVGMSISFNTGLTELTIRGNDVDDVKMLLREVGYANTNGHPKPGYRTVRVKTNATCDGKPLPVQEQKIPILANAVVDPKITISGVGLKQRTVAEFALGVDVFTEVMILSDPGKELDNQENRINKLDIEDVSTLQADLKKKLTLDKCEVRISEKMDPGHEILRLPTFLLVKYLLDSKEFDGGFDILGADSFANYEAVLRETYYINTRAGSNFTSRTFSVKCTSMNGKFVSNTFDIKVDLMNSQAQSAVLYADPQYAHIQEQGLLVAGNAAAGVQSAVGTGTGSGTVAAVVVVCLLAVLVVIVVAVVRIRKVQRRTKHTLVEEGEEMEWDNSTLNITVNPLENATLVKEVKDGEMCEDSEDELMTSDDEDDETPRDGGLEWDNSSY